MTIVEARVLLVGCGNMGFSLLNGWRKKEIKVDVIARSYESNQKALALGAEIIETSKSIKTPDRWDAIVYAVKPKDAKNVIECYQSISGDTLHISVMAGITVDFIENTLGNAQDRIVVRTMPNTPSLIGRGVIVSCGNKKLSKHNKNTVDSLMGVCGDSLWVEDESLMDLVTALSGSGPAYIFYYIEEMIRIGIELGLEPKLSHDLALGVVSGAAEMAVVMHREGQTVETLRQNVTSKGGTTQAAIKILSDQKNGLGQILKTAIIKARERAYELGQKLK